MIEGLDYVFTLVPRRDRRQLPDRRSTWRGGRRASDVQAPDGFGTAHGSFDWVHAEQESGDEGVKPVLH